MPLVFTRAVSPKLAECELTHVDRAPIDVAKAVAQHAAYEDALRQSGLDLIRLPALPDHPDAVFVEDTALLLDGHAVITRPGAGSRTAETASTEAGLADHFEIHRSTKGFVDGGDILRIGQTLYAGLSSRTDAAGIRNLREIAGQLGFRVEEAKLAGCLHLKTGATFAGHDQAGNPILLFHSGCVDPTQFADVIPEAVDADEPGAANSLRIGDRLIFPAGNPKTAERLRNRGLNLVEVDISELEKAEAGVTCLSLIAN